MNTLIREIAKTMDDPVKAKIIELAADKIDVVLQMATNLTRFTADLIDAIEPVLQATAIATDDRSVVERIERARATLQITLATLAQTKGED